MPAPIEITLYGPDDAPLKTYHKSRVPYGLLKRAVRTLAALEEAEVSADGNAANAEAALEPLDELSSFVVDAFGGQFTVEQLEEGTELGELLTALKSIVARAGTLVKANPTPPPRRSK